MLLAAYCVAQLCITERNTGSFVINIVAIFDGTRYLIEHNRSGIKVWYSLNSFESGGDTRLDIERTRWGIRLFSYYNIVSCSALCWQSPCSMVPLSPVFSFQDITCKYLVISNFQDKHKIEWKTFKLTIKKALKHNINKKNTC